MLHEISCIFELTACHVDRLSIIILLGLGVRLARASIFHVKRFHVNEVYNKAKEHTFLCQFV